ncbi:hypothetical protein [Amycolatopsis plumensis]|uniref:Uncharacterized protein n=1 Tax=Amycolatopsis plumensis TaxID=236508 RepID=A0ABV5U8K3_9PSEU
MTAATGGYRLFAIRLMVARASLISFVTLALVLGSSVGHLAIQERNWPARIVMLTILAGIWCSFFALAAVHAHSPRQLRRMKKTH